MSRYINTTKLYKSKEIVNIFSASKYYNKGKIIKKNWWKY